MNYEIYEANFKTLTEKLTRLNAKLLRIGAKPVTFTITGHVDHPSATDATKLVRYINLEVTGDTPTCNGWEFVATIVHTEEGNITRSKPGYTVPAEYRDAPAYCSHCKTNRMRNDTYIVQHTRDGRVMQVGSSCLEDFLGTSPHQMTKASEHLFNAFDVCSAATRIEWLKGSANVRHIYRIDLDTFLGHVAAVVLKDGRYITRKMVSAAGHGNSTSDKAQMAMNGVLGQPYEITPEATALAYEARQWVLRKYSPVLADPEDMTADAIRDMVITSFKSANRTLGDFEHNLLACARAEAIEPRLCGIAAYIIEAYRRSLPQPKIAQLNVNGMPRIFAMFTAATESKLKHPAIRLADDASSHLHLSLAGAASKNAGSIYVKSGDRYYGKITPEGRFFPVRECPPTVERQLLQFAADPETVAAKYGKLTGRCCFCGRNLTDDRSTDVGYGPVCAGKFGLNWGASKQDDFVAAEAAKQAAEVGA